MAEDKKYKFQVREGRVFHKGTPEQVEAGEIVELTIEQAKDFAFRYPDFANVLTPVDVPKTVVKNLAG